MVKKNLASLDKKIKNFSILDFKLVKWSVLCWTLFLITVWPWLRNIVLSVNWYIWLGLGIVLMIKPVIKYFK